MSEDIKVREISDREIWVNTNKISLIGENTIYVVAVGEQTTSFAFAQKQIFDKLAQKAGGKINFLINLNDAGKSSPEARKLWQQLCEAESTNKVALFGLHPVAKVLASFVMGRSKVKNLRFFSTEEEAMDWLMK